MFVSTKIINRIQMMKQSDVMWSEPMEQTQVLEQVQGVPRLFMESLKYLISVVLGPGSSKINWV